jgi:putative membrane protein
MRKALLTMLRGVLMGAADIVPGVSGGTVALVLGIYTRLIGSIRSGSSAIGNLLRGDVRGFRTHLGEVEWGFLIPLGVGILAAILSLAQLIETLLLDHPEAMAGLFLGLVAGSVVVAWRLVGHWDARRLGIGAVAAVLTFLLLGLKESTSTDVAADAGDYSLLAFFLAGAVAICAMILPGVSGSFLLVILGMYGAVLSAVNDRDVVVVAVFALGCVVGLGLFSQLLHWALATRHDAVMAALIGLMVGSTRVLWPWPAGVDSTALGTPAGPVLMPVVMAVGGFVLVVGFDFFARRLEHRSIADEVTELEQL